MAENPMITEEERLKMNPHGFLYMKKVVLEQLREMGTSEEILKRLCVVGPRNFFEGV
jgi:predicted metal-dependent phosphotriesterase family hydrolase